MTIDKADLVKRVAEKRDEYIEHTSSWCLMEDVISFITQQSQGRDEVLEEAACIADGFTCGGCGMDGKSSKAIRALKSPSPAPVERRSEVEDRRKSAGGDLLKNEGRRRRPHLHGRRSADRARWTGGGEKVCPHCGMNEGCSHTLLERLQFTPTAQPEPQGLVKRYEEALVTIRTLLSYANVDMATEANKEVHINRAWHVATEALKSAAITGGK